MKVSLFTALVLAAPALSAVIEVVMLTGTLTVGDPFLVSLFQTPNQVSSNIGVAIGLISCGSDQRACVEQEAAGSLGAVLYSGVYNPNAIGVEPYENFTLTVPTNTPAGSGIVSVFYAGVNETSHAPLLESHFVALNID